MRIMHIIYLYNIYNNHHPFFFYLFIIWWYFFGDIPILLLFSADDPLCDDRQNTAQAIRLGYFYIIFR